MALMANPWWTLVLGACLALTVRGDCEKDCELCLVHLQGAQTERSLVTCVQECDGSVTTTKSLDLCKDALRGNLPGALTEEAAGQGAGGQQEPLAKRYGGFMRRYGGFMKKSAEVGAETADALVKRYGGFMKKDGEGRLDALKELLAAANGEGGDGEPGKRYGAYAGAVTRGAELEGGARALQKRYGGFMRRVGSPNWEESKKVYEGFIKRSWGTDGEAGSPRAEKRYGGFMD
ncbi:proenkephalin-A-like [Conger conger]|uniref:proenkephalin-A-like n=1 Tax=Conger conger TaxID=82655 RepID=UPI002A5A891B|nr:proenkephalin-A-like [Conger conger]